MRSIRTDFAKAEKGFGTLWLSLIHISSPSPDAPPFVLVGQKVKEGDTLFIVEAMKTMNEIKSPCDGTVVRILAQPGDMVEYNQIIVVIE